MPVPTPRPPRSASATFSGSPTRRLPHVALQDLLDELLSRVVQVFDADQGAILLRADDGSRLELHAARGLPPGLGRDSYRSIADRLAGRLASSRRPVTLERDEMTALQSLLATADMQSVLGLPLILDRQLLGVLYVGTRKRSPFSEDDAALLQLVGDRVALAVDRARLFEQERHIAETLQRSLLPEQLPHIPGMDVAVRYLPAGAGMEVGGDWFDMFELGDGRVVLAMGDVVGRGVRAAALMGKLRTSLEAYAFDGRSPEEVVERLHWLMERQHRTEMATLLYVVIDADRAGTELATPDTCRCSSGTQTAAPRASLQQDVTAARRAPVRPLPVVPYRLRARLDARSSSRTGLWRCAAPASNCVSRSYGARSSRPARPRALATLPRARWLARTSRRTTSPCSPSASLRSGTRLHARSPRGARGALISRDKSLERWLSEAGTSRRDTHAIKVACGEACANAIEHAYRPGDAAFRIEASRWTADVLIIVRDFGGWREPRGTDRGRGLPLMEALMDSVQVDPSSEGTTVQLRRRLAGTEHGDDAARTAAPRRAGGIMSRPSMARSTSRMPAELEMAISHAVANEALGLVIDLGRVDYLDSSGVTLLFNLARRVARRQQGSRRGPGGGPCRRDPLAQRGGEALALHESLAEALSELNR